MCHVWILLLINIITSLNQDFITKQLFLYHWLTLPQGGRTQMITVTAARTILDLAKAGLTITYQLVKIIPLNAIDCEHLKLT